ncbi:MAG: sialidase family protein [Dermatophilaceae bacterium]
MTSPDPIEEFFARERSSITREPADEQRWEAIAAAGRRGRRSRWSTFAAAAAAAVLVGGIGYAVGRGLPGATDGTDVAGHGSSTTALTTPTSPTTTASVGVTPSGSTRHTAGASSTTPSMTASVNTALPMPNAFRTISMSQADGSTVFALGVGMCTDHDCLVAVRSTDGGTSWQRVATFPDTPVSGGMPAVGAKGSFTQIRMANARVGWVFGDGILQTTDGGLTWHTYAHAGQSVLDLALADGQVAIVSTSGACDGTRCKGDLLTQIAPANATAATTPVATTKTDGVLGASVAWWKGRAIVSPIGTAGAASPFAADAGGRATPLDPGCGGQASARIVAPSSGDTLLAACPDGAGAGSIFYSIHRSADDGATWTAVRGDPVQLVNAGGVSFAATDADHLVATSGGSADVHGSLKVTADGGATWSAVTDPAVPDTGWGWVGAPGPNWFYLVAVDSARGYYWSHDKGATWTWTEMS